MILLARSPNHRCKDSTDATFPHFIVKNIVYKDGKRHLECVCESCGEECIEAHHYDWD